MNPIFRIASIAAVLALLAGCGNKGPLVLPTQPAPIDPATVPASAPAESTPPVDPAADAAATEAAEDPAPTTGDEPAPPPPPPADEDGNG